MKQLYVVQSGELSHSWSTTSPGKALRHMLNTFHLRRTDLTVLVRWRSRDAYGRWTKWQYQDLQALLKEA